MLPTTEPPTVRCGYLHLDLSGNFCGTRAMQQFVDHVTHARPPEWDWLRLKMNGQRPHGTPLAVPAQRFPIASHTLFPRAPPLDALLRPFDQVFGELSSH